MSVVADDSPRFPHGEEITDLEYQPTDAGVYNTRCTGRYRGVRIYSLAYIAPEMAYDVPVLEAFLKSILLSWAQEHWQTRFDSLEQ